MKTITTICFWTIMITATLICPSISGESFSEDDMRVIDEIIRNTFNNENELKNMPPWCTKESIYEIGVIMPLFYVETAKFTADDSHPAKVSPFTIDSGIYRIAVMVENKGCFINLIRRKNGRIKWCGVDFCNTCADQMVEVIKKLSDKEELIDRVVFLTCLSLDKILVIYKNGEEEWYNSSTKNDSVPNTAEEIRDYLRNYMEVKNRSMPIQAMENQ